MLSVPFVEHTPNSHPVLLVPVLGHPPLAPRSHPHPSCTAMCNPRHDVFLFSLGILVVTLTPCCGSESRPAELASNTSPAAIAEDPILGDPIVVNGVEISIEEIKRHTLLVSYAGRVAFEVAKIRVLIDQEMQRQIEHEGRASEDFAISQAEIDAATDLARHGSRHPLTSWSVVPSGFHEDDREPDADAGQTALFRKVFLPRNPHDYPPVTADALSQGEESGPQILDALQGDWDRHSRSGVEPLDDADPGARLFDRMLVQLVTKYLTETSAIREMEDGISEDLLGILNGVEIWVDDIWETTRDRIHPVDVWKAKRWLVNVTVLFQAMERSGCLLSPDEADAIWKEQADPLDCWTNREWIALNLMKFPTLGMYRTYHRLYESYRRQIVDDITDEVLEKHGRERTDAIVGQSRVDVDIVLLAAYDFERKEWKENGWAEAADRAREVATQLAAGESWEDLLEEYSDFRGPPIDLRMKTAQPRHQLGNQGRLRGLNRHDLARVLEEPEFLVFLTGNSVTDVIFFEQKVGTIENPIRGPYGYYIPRLYRRSSPTVDPTAYGARRRSHLERDYVTERLRLYTKELLTESVVSGL